MSRAEGVASKEWRGQFPDSQLSNASFPKLSHKPWAPSLPFPTFSLTFTLLPFYKREASSVTLLHVNMVYWLPDGIIAEWIAPEGQSLKSKAIFSVRNTEGCAGLLYLGYKPFANSLPYPSIHEIKFSSEVAAAGKTFSDGGTVSLGHRADNQEWLLIRQ